MLPNSDNTIGYPKEVHMAITKADLLTENRDLKEQLLTLQAELDALKSQAKVPANLPVISKIEISLDNPVFAELQVYQPHSRVQCPVHGDAKTNKIGLCTECSNARIRPANYQDRRARRAAAH